jgi:hypothetical protein
MGKRERTDNTMGKRERTDNTMGKRERTDNIFMVKEIHAIFAYSS